MFEVYNCLTAQHDWRLVGVAAVICLFASLSAVNIFNRARATSGRTRVIWIMGHAFRGDVGL
jgi:NO-binding membrane sensor protein with MHYT domain